MPPCSSPACPPACSTTSCSRRAGPDRLPAFSKPGRRFNGRRNLFAIAGTLTALAAGPAWAQAGTHVAISSWHVYSASSQLHKVKPGATFKACASDPTAELDAKGKVSGAKKGHDFQEIWSVNGHQDSLFNAQWLRNGTFTDYFNISANDGSLKTGKWSVKLVQDGKTIGHSDVTVKTKTGC